MISIKNIELKRLFQAEVFRVVTPCSVMEGKQSFSGHRYPTTELHGITTQKTPTWNFTALKASNLA